MSPVNSQSFSVLRCYQLLLGEIRLHTRSALLTSAVLASLIVLFHLTQDAWSEDSSVLGKWMGPIAVIWGLIEASKVFNDMHSRNTMPTFLLLPASALEKTMAKFLLVTCVFWLYLCLFAVAVSLLCAFLSFAVLGHAISPPVLFNHGAWSVLHVFAISQSIYFLGGAWFKRSQIAKTGICLLLTFIALAFFVITLAKLLAPEAMFGEAGASIDFGAFIADNDDKYIALARTLATAFFIVVPVLSFCLSWFRVREVQLSDGI